MTSALTQRLQRQQSALLKIARAWRSHEGDVNRAIHAITETAVEALQVERASVWLLNDARDKLILKDLLQARSGEHSKGAELSRSDYPTYFGALESAEVIAAVDAHRDPTTSEFSSGYLGPLGIGAMLDAPIRLGGQLIGVLCHEHVGEQREWPIDEQNAASYLASLVSLALEIDRRQLSEQKLAESLSLLQATIESAGVGILAVNPAGSVVAHNQRMVELWGLRAELLGPEGDGGPRLEFLADQTVDPAGYVKRARELFSDPRATSIDRIDLADGRVFERSSRPQLLDGEPIGRVWSFRDVTEETRAEESLRRAEEVAREAAQRDGLTGLFNRTHLLDGLRQALLLAHRHSQPCSVAMMDLDHFKRINDSYGHQTGDEVLQAFAAEVKSRLRRSDVIGRYGGEEFLVILPQTDREGACRVMDEIRARIDRERQSLPRFSVSIGVAEAPVDATSLEGLLRAADVRLYAAKDAGRNCVR